MRPPQCKDCIATGATRWRPIADGCGPRTPLCVTHQRERKSLRRERAHATHIERQYGISDKDYKAIYVSQDGRCFVCRRATGARRKLSVDHDHDLGCGHPPDVGCRECVRCLACKTCNRIILGRYSVDALRRAIQVLEDPPAQKVLRKIMEVRDEW